jgi:hypothetical protein
MSTRRRKHAWRVCRHAMCGVVWPLLIGCTAGDFGRPRYDWTADVDVLSVDAVYTGSIGASDTPLTDEERQLRALARRLLTPPEERSPLFAAPRFDRTLMLEGPSPSGEAYVSYLLSDSFRSSGARYAKLIEDTRNEIARLDQFFTLARRVADLDEKRGRSLPHVSALSHGELTNAHRRTRENMMLISEVHRTLLNRAAVYRLALERLVITVPSPMAAEAERVRLEFERQLGLVQVFAAR